VAQPRVTLEKWAG